MEIPYSRKVELENSVSYLLATEVALEAFIGLSYSTSHLNYGIPIVHVNGNFHFAISGSGRNGWDSPTAREDFFEGSIFGEMRDSFDRASQDIKNQVLSFPLYINDVEVTRWENIQNVRYRNATPENHLRGAKRHYLKQALSNGGGYSALFHGFMVNRVAEGWRRPVELVGEKDGRVVFA